MTLVGSSFIAMLLAGVPIAFVLGLSCLAYLLLQGDLEAMLVIPQKMYQGTDSFVLVAIPFYLLAAELMNATGITQRIVRFLTVLFGHFRGALAQVNVVSSMLFAGISGTASADAAAIGGVMIPSMVKAGYTPQFAAALTAAAATIGPIVPPSMVMIIYAVFANVSVAALFIGGVIPGVMLGLFLMVVIGYYARKGKLPAASERATRQELWRGFADAVLALLMPAIILGGILAGVFTATEAACVAVVYAAFLGAFVYKTLNFAVLFETLERTAITTGGLLLIAATGLLFGWMMAAEQIPAKVANAMLGFSDSPWVFLVLVNLLLLFLGTFMDTLAALIIVVPVLVPVASKLNIDLVHFGVVVCFNLIQGMLTPPLGVLLFICSQIARIRFENMLGALLPFLIANLVVLGLITFIPTLVLLLPKLAGY